jgi:hypothetical protein
MSDYQRLSADLSRICEFLLSDNKPMVDKFTKRIKDLYLELPGNIGKHALSEYLAKIINAEGGKELTAERALTASLILSTKS